MTESFCKSCGCGVSTPKRGARAGLPPADRCIACRLREVEQDLAKLHAAHEPAPREVNPKCEGYPSCDKFSFAPSSHYEACRAAQGSAIRFTVQASPLDCPGSRSPTLQQMLDAWTVAQTESLQGYLDADNAERRAWDKIQLWCDATGGQYEVRGRTCGFCLVILQNKYGVEVHEQAKRKRADALAHAAQWCENELNRA